MSEDRPDFAAVRRTPPPGHICTRANLGRSDARTMCFACVVCDKRWFAPIPAAERIEVDAEPEIEHRRNVLVERWGLEEVDRAIADGVYRFPESRGEK